MIERYYNNDILKRVNETGEINEAALEECWRLAVEGFEELAEVEAEDEELFSMYKGMKEVIEGGKELAITKGDRYLCHTLYNIMVNGFVDEYPRPKYGDGKPAHTLSINQTYRKYNIAEGEIPITTLRPIAWKSGIKEVLWIYQKQSNDLRVLNEEFGVKYWNEWESKDVPGTIGHRYGYVVKQYNLMEELLASLSNPETRFGRRHIINLYQYKEMEETDGLHPCAFCSEWMVRRDRMNGKLYLDMTLVQRSGDSLAASCSGVNEMQYLALMMMVARHCGLEVGRFVHHVNNEQIYGRHLEAAFELMFRGDWVTSVNNRLYKRWRKCKFGEDDARCFMITEVNEHQNPQPVLILNPDKKNFYDIGVEDFTLLNYHPIKPQLKLDLGI